MSLLTGLLVHAAYVCLHTYNTHDHRTLYSFDTLPHRSDSSGKPSMAATHAPWLKQMRSSMCGMHKCIKEIKAVSLPLARKSAHLPCMRMLKNLLQAISNTMTSQPEPLDTCTQAQFDDLITVYTSLLSDLMPQLDRFASRLGIVATSIRPLEEEVFDQLWQFLLTGCLAFHEASQRRPVLLLIDEQSCYVHLYAAHDALLHWLLCFTRSPAWLYVTRQDGVWNSTSVLSTVLTQLLTCMYCILDNASNLILLSHVTYILPTSLPLLCCITSEQVIHILESTVQAQLAAGRAGRIYPNGLSHELDYMSLFQFLDLLTSVVRAVILTDKVTGHSGKFACLTAPAVLHLFKQVLILTPNTPSLPPDLVPSCLECLDQLGNLSNKDIVTNPGPPLSVSDAITNQDAAGLPLHLNPCLSRQMLKTDVRLLHALSAHLAADTALTRDCHAVQVNILESWIVAGMKHPTSSEDVYVMVKSVGGIAKHCSSHGLLVMQQLCHGKQEKACRQEKHAEGAKEQQQEAMPPDIHVAEAGDNQLASKRLEVKECLKHLMLVTAHFQMKIQQGPYVGLPRNAQQSNSKWATLLRYTLVTTPDC